MTTPSNGTEPSAPINDQDLELMRFLDGELDEAEASALADPVQAAEVAQAVAAGVSREPASEENVPAALPPSSAGQE